MKRPFALLVSAMLTSSAAQAQWAETITPLTTPIKATHIIELRAQIDSGLVICGLPAQTWTNAALAPKVTTIKKTDIDELRTATQNLVNAYRAQAMLPATSLAFTDATIIARTTPIKAAHINEIRTYVLGATCNTIHGICGPANGAPAASAPVAGLCAAGNPTAPTGSGPWAWSCTSPNGGTTAACMTGGAGAGTCGASHLATVVFPPTTGLCSSGVPTAPQFSWQSPTSAIHPIHWQCVGTTTASCKASSAFQWAYCFVAGTQVTLSSGKTKSIEDIRVGELVQTYDEYTREMTFSAVEEVFAHEEKRTELFTFVFGKQRLTSNDQHRLFLPRENAYLSAKQIYNKWLAGEEIFFLNTRREESRVVRIDVREDIVPLYNLHVKGRYDGKQTSRGELLSLANHNYFANGVLAHNVKWCGGQSAGTAIFASADLCNPSGPSGNDICNLSWNVMRCAFQTAADEAAFHLCAGNYFDTLTTTCPKPGEW